MRGVASRRYGRRAMRIVHAAAAAMGLALCAAAPGTANAANVLGIVCTDPPGDDYLYIDLDAKYVRMRTTSETFEYRDGVFGLVLQRSDAVPRKQFVVVTDDYVKYGVRVGNE